MNQYCIYNHCYDEYDLIEGESYEDALQKAHLFPWEITLIGKL